MGIISTLQQNPETMAAVVTTVAGAKIINDSVHRHADQSPFERPALATDLPSAPISNASVIRLSTADEWFAVGRGDRSLRYHHEDCRCCGSATCIFQAPSEFPALRRSQELTIRTWEANKNHNRMMTETLHAQQREEARIRDERLRAKAAEAAREADRLAAEASLKITEERRARERQAHEHAEAMRAHAERIRTLHHFVWIWTPDGTEPLAQLDASVHKNTSYLVGDIWDSGNGLYRVIERRWINNALNIKVELT